MQIVLDKLQPHIVILSENDLKNYEVERLNIEYYNINYFYSRQSFKTGRVMISGNKELSGKEAGDSAKVFDC